MLDRDLLDSLEKIVDKGVNTSGQEFFDVITLELCNALDADVIFIGELVPPHNTHVKTVSRAVDGKIVENKIYSVANTPCEQVTGKTACCFPSDVQQMYPDDSFLQNMGIEGYLAVPLFDSNQVPMGHVAALYKNPIEDDRLATVVLQLFSGRLCNELERLKISDQLVESTQLYQSIVHNIHDYLILFDKDGHVYLSSNSVHKLNLYEEGSAEANCFDLFDQETARTLKYKLDKITPESPTIYIETEIKINADERRWIQWHIKGIYGQDNVFRHYESLGRDLTELKQSEEARHNIEFMLHHAEKMTAIGELAGGVAHDFNNQLTSIKGYAELLLNTHSEGDTVYRYAENIHKSAKRSADITKQLLSFSRIKSPDTIEVDMHSMIDEVYELLFHSMDKKISLTKALDAEEPFFIANPSLIQNVLMNLVINARDACGECGEIVVRTTTQNYTKKDFKAKGLTLPKGNYIKVSVEDNGSGIDPEIIHRVFDPFFTTKDIGKGSGIGLTAAYNTMATHNGHVWIESELGVGTSVNIIFPSIIHEVKESNQSIPTQASKDQQAVYNIMVVDDEPMVLEVSTLMLETLDHNVESCSSPEIALEQFMNRPEHYDLIVIDMVMPEMSGKELFIKLKEINPNVVAAISSGYQMNERNDELLAIGIKGFINKPFSMDNLTSSLNEIMNQ